MQKLPRIEVYLAGGFKSGWQDRVKNALVINGLVHRILLYDPRLKQTRGPEEHWPWDIYKIRRAQILFVYIEDWRPELIGTGHVLELGIGIGLGDKLIILVNEVRHRYYTQFQVLPNVVYFENLKDGIDYLVRCGNG